MRRFRAAPIPTPAASLDRAIAWNCSERRVDRDGIAADAARSAARRARAPGSRARSRPSGGNAWASRLNRLPPMPDKRISGPQSRALRRKRGTMSRRRMLLPALVLLSALAFPATPALAQGGLPQITAAGRSRRRRSRTLRRQARCLRAAARRHVAHGDHRVALPEEFRPEDRAEGRRARPTTCSTSTPTFIWISSQGPRGSRRSARDRRTRPGGARLCGRVATNPAVFNEAAQYYRAPGATSWTATSTARRCIRRSRARSTLLRDDAAFHGLPASGARQGRRPGDRDRRAGRPGSPRALARKLMIAGRQASLFVQTNASRDMDLAGLVPR